jgi:hypothetical protein
MADLLTKPQQTLSLPFIFLWYGQMLEMPWWPTLEDKKKGWRGFLESMKLLHRLLLGHACVAGFVTISDT